MKAEKDAAVDVAEAADSSVAEEEEALRAMKRSREAVEEVQEDVAESLVVVPLRTARLKRLKPMLRLRLPLLTEQSEATLRCR